MCLFLMIFLSFHGVWEHPYLQNPSQFDSQRYYVVVLLWPVVFNLRMVFSMRRTKRWMPLVSWKKLLFCSPYQHPWSYICPVHLPGQNIFCPDKIFFSKLKKYIFACEMDGKWFFSQEKFLSMAKNSFSIHFKSKYVLFWHRKKFFVQTKNVLSRQMEGA